MSNKYSSSFELREKLLSGVNKLSDTVASTLGPRGHNVIIRRSGHGAPIITKDGVTVANSISFEDHFEDLGAQVVKQATSKTNTEAGDGTTTSTVLTQAMLQGGFSILGENVSVSHLKAGMTNARNDAVALLKSFSREMSSIDDIRHVAYVSSNGDTEITDMICEAVSSIGKGGSITIEEARSNTTSLELLEGFSFDSGYAATAFVTDDRLNVCRYENPLFLITDERIETVDQILPSLEIAAREARPFIIIADDIEGQALAALIMNSVRGSMKVAAIKAPRYGEERRQIMSDLAVTVDAKYFNHHSGETLANTTISISDFGSARSILVRKGSTTIVGGTGDAAAITTRVSLIEDEVRMETSESVLRSLLERKNRLVSGIAVIKVGAPTELEMVEKKHRIEDALEAVRSAQEEGYIPGGGLSLFAASQTIRPPDLEGTHSDSYVLGYNVVKDALAAPMAKLCQNSSVDFEQIKSEFRYESGTDSFIGFDFSSECHVDMVSAGIIDPTKVARCAVENAVSVSSTLLSTSVAIIEQ